MPGITFEQLDKIVMSSTDLEAAKMLKKKKDVLFQTIPTGS